MTSGPSIPAIIPARGGSKGIPGKNMRMLDGRPLICHTIQAALQARGICKVILSTDDPEIADVGQSWGAWVPFLRPPELAMDDTPMSDVVLHSLDFLDSEWGEPTESFCLLQPTSPLRGAVHIDAAIELFYRSNAESVISVTEFEHSVLWALRVSDQGVISPREASLPLIRQEAETFYRPNGAIYLSRSDAYRQKRTFFLERTRALIMAAENSVDIDTEFDLRLAEFHLRDRGSNG